MSFSDFSESSKITSSLKTWCEYLTCFHLTPHLQGIVPEPVSTILSKPSATKKRPAAAKRKAVAGGRSYTLRKRKECDFLNSDTRAAFV